MKKENIKNVYLKNQKINYTETWLVQVNSEGSSHKTHSNSIMEINIKNSNLTYTQDDNFKIDDQLLILETTTGDVELTLFATYVNDSFYAKEIKQKLKSLGILFASIYVIENEQRVVHMYIDVKNLQRHIKGKSDFGKGLHYVVHRLIGETGYTSYNSKNKGLLYADGIRKL